MRSFITLFLLLCSWFSGMAQSRKAMLLPQPQQVTWSDETFRIPADALPADWSKLPHWPQLQVTVDSTRQIAPIPTEEAYRLTVRAQQVLIEATAPQGVYWALQTLHQLAERQPEGWTIPGCCITDWPAFRIRGWMQDVGRSYLSLKELKREIELLSRYKVNVFHWHLTENQAWRLESKRFPALQDSLNMTRMPG